MNIQGRATVLEAHGAHILMRNTVRHWFDASGLHNRANLYIITPMADLEKVVCTSTMSTALKLVFVVNVNLYSLRVKTSLLEECTSTRETVL